MGTPRATAREADTDTLRLPDTATDLLAAAAELTAAATVVDTVLILLSTDRARAHTLQRL